MDNKELLLCADKKCINAGECYRYTVNPIDIRPKKFKVVDTLRDKNQLICTFFQPTKVIS